MNEILKQVAAFAGKAHAGQTRKYTPDKYIEHPLHVMEICSRYTNNLPVLAAALLHDVVEDTPVSLTRINDFLKKLMPAAEVRKTVQLVNELTDVYTKTAYPQWNRDKRKQMELKRMEHNSADAQTIKYADVIDNCNGIARYDPHFGKRFLYECKALLHVLDKGNATLRNLAQKEVVAGLKQL